MKTLIIALALSCSLLHGAELKPSEVSKDGKMVQKRERDLSKWISVKDYQKFFDKNFEKAKYPIYVESDSDGKRRMIWVDRPKSVHVGVKTNRSPSEVIKLHREKSGQGKVLLSAYEWQVDGDKVYNIIWIDKGHLKQAMKDLKKYGISQAIIK